MIIRCKEIYTDKGAVDGYLVVEEGIIKAIESASANLNVDVDASNQRIIPGIFDTHNHGVMGYALMSNQDNIDEVIKGYLKGCASHGVTSVLATAHPDIIKDVAKAAKETQDGAKIVGIHSEGPYLSRVGEKGINTGYPDIDMDYVKKMVSDGEGLLKLVAIAPEIPQATEAIHYFVSQGVRCAFAHSDLDYDGALASFKQGVTVATHTANVMSGIHHRHMGGLGACLLDEDLWCEVICDGLHVNNEMLKLMFKVKPYEKFMMISDNVPIAGAPIGRYNLIGFLPVIVDDKGFCLSDTGRLCGSTKPVIYGISNLVNNLSIPLETCLKMAAENPAIVYETADTKGTLTVGKDADFVIIDDSYNVLETYSEGRKVYDHLVDTDLFYQTFIDLCKED